MLSAVLRCADSSPQRLIVRCGTSIRVVLVQDLANKGSAGEVVEVKRGHARNLLIPRKIAMYATRENLAQFARGALGEGAKERQRADSLSAGEVVVMERAGNAKGLLFDPINVHEISQHIRMTLGKRPLKIFLPQPIRRHGRHAVLIDDAVQVVLEVLPSTSLA